MHFLGNDFLNKTVHQSLEIFWAVFFTIWTFFGVIILITLYIYLLFTSYWWLPLTISVLTYLDRKTKEEGGRPINWVQNLSCFRYGPTYFNGQVVYNDGFALNSEKNYLFCVYPHGVIPVGPIINLLLKCSKFRELYKNFDVRFAVLWVLLFVPLFRDFVMAMGFVACSFKSLNLILSKPEGGNIVLLAVGGVEDCRLTSVCGQYKCIVRQRKGFVKVALKTGASVVPVMTFGEHDLYDHVDIPALRNVQDLVKKYLGFYPVIFNGGGIFQNSFGLLPRRTQLTTVLGKPIEVQKVDSPMDEQVNQLHSRFVKELELLFEKHKHKYLKNPNDIYLEFY